MAADAFRNAALSAEDFRQAVAEALGMLDKRSALRAAREAIRAFNQELEDAPGKLRPGTAAWDAAEASLDDIARSSLTAAEHLQGMGRVDFLDKQRDQFIAAARAMDIPIGRAKRMADAFGLLDKTHAKPTVDADDTKANRKLDAALRALRGWDGSSGEATVDGNAGPLFGVIDSARRALQSIDGYVATTTIRTIQQTVRDIVPGGNADGGTIGGPRHPYGDKVLSWLAPGEEIISNRHGQADRFRADRAMGLIPTYADGGQNRGGGSEGRPVRNGGRGGLLDDVGGALHEAGEGAKSLKQRLKEATKELEKETEKRRELRDKMDEFRSGVRGTFNGDIFGNGLAGLDLQLQADRNDARSMKFALARAKKKGLDGGLFAALAQSGDLNTATELAALSSSQIAARERLFAQTNAARSGLADFATNTQYGPIERERNKVIRELRGEIRELRKQLPKAVENGARRGVGDRDKSGSQRRRAGR